MSTFSDENVFSNVESPEFRGVKPLIDAIEARTPSKDAEPVHKTSASYVSAVDSDAQKTADNHSVDLPEPITEPMAPEEVLPPAPPLQERRVTRSSSGLRGNLSSAMTTKLLEKVASSVNTANAAVSSTAVVTNKRRSNSTSSGKVDIAPATTTTNNASSAPSIDTTSKIVNANTACPVKDKITAPTKVVASVAAAARTTKTKTAEPTAGAHRSSKAPLSRASKAATSTAVRPKSASSTTAATTAATTTSTHAHTAREAARLSKEAAVLDRQAKVVALKQKWKQEKEEKLQNNARLREAQQLALKRRNETAAISRRRHIEKKKEQEELLAAQTRQELHDKLVADKMQQAILEAEEKERRRDSLAEKLKIWRQEKEHEKMQQVQQQTETERAIADRYETWMAHQEYKAAEDQHRRQSLALRLDAWRAEKELTARQADIASEAAVVERELQTAVEADVKHYKEKMVLNRRESLAMRLDKARHDADVAEHQKFVERELEQERRRLDEQDREDVKNNNEFIINARRQSIALRNQYAHKQALEQQIKDQQEAEVEALNQNLVHAAWEDVRQYQEECRRAELSETATRIAESRRYQEIALEEHALALNTMHEDLESKRQDWLDIRKAKELEKERSRKSIGLRIDSWRKQRIEEATAKSIAEARAHEDARLRELDRELMSTHRLEMEKDAIAERLHSGLCL